MQVINENERFLPRTKIISQVKHFSKVLNNVYTEDMNQFMRTHNEIVTTNENYDLEKVKRYVIEFICLLIKFLI